VNSATAAVAVISKIKASLRKLLSSKLEALLVGLWGQARVNLSLQQTKHGSQ